MRRRDSARAIPPNQVIVIIGKHFASRSIKGGADFERRARALQHSVAGRQLRASVALKRSYYEDGTHRFAQLGKVFRKTTIVTVDKVFSARIDEADPPSR
jgi:hypothetical protein